MDEPRPAGRCPESFPAKVTALLAERFTRLNGDPTRGLVFLPCELIDRNGATAPDGACSATPKPGGWARTSSAGSRSVTAFSTPWVDRIVPGYPHEEIPALTEALGYEDRLLTTGEVFHVWVIEGDAAVAEELPLTRAGLNVVWTPDCQPFRTRKVRILNGAHTMTALPAYLAGLNTVRECGGRTPRSEPISAAVSSTRFCRSWPCRRRTPDGSPKTSWSDSPTPS